MHLSKHLQHSPTIFHRPPYIALSGEQHLVVMLEGGRQLLRQPLRIRGLFGAEPVLAGLLPWIPEGRPCMTPMANHDASIDGNKG